MYIDGSWVDVTGRINVTRNDHFKIWVSMKSDVLVSSSHSFQRRYKSYNATDDISFFITPIWSGPGDFNTCAPHQSRLIALTGTEILKKSADGIKALKTGSLTIYTGIRNDSPFNVPLFDTWSSTEELKPIQLEITEDGYIYNTILSEDQMFVTDSFGVEVFIEPRS